MATGNSQGTAVMVQGRIVWTAGNLFTGKPKVDPNTKQPKMNNQGQQVIEYGIGLAVPKSALAAQGPGQPGEILAAMQKEALQVFPSGQFPPAFAWKFKDGDGVDHNGASFAGREGYAGHIVFALTTTIPIKFFRYENGQNIQVSDGIKCGDYVNVQVLVKAHPAIGQGKPGLYLNPNAVQLLRVGQEIVNTPSGDDIFGTVAPPGLDYTPVAPQAGLLVPPSQVQGQPFGAPAAAFPGAPMQPQAAPVAAPAMPAPNYGVVPQQFQPPAQAPQMPAAPMQSVPPGGWPQAAAAPVGMPMAAPQAQPYQQPGVPQMPGQPTYPVQPGGFPLPGQR